ncbi:MAG: hypothetical protein CMK59_02265 [Proteobacteria bacterium]|nr:hypothetical protein [Pseudomonadota bacterium]
MSQKSVGLLKVIVLGIDFKFVLLIITTEVCMEDYFFACPHCFCQTKGKSIVQCGSCRKIFCSVCGSIFKLEEDPKPYAKCVHCTTTLPINWSGQRSDPRLEAPKEHRRLGVVGKEN